MVSSDGGGRWSVFDQIAFEPQGTVTGRLHTGRPHMAESNALERLIRLWMEQGACVTILEEEK
jgi:hypothetical protein